MKIITVSNIKGGVGKSTLSSFLGYTFSQNKKVLLIDLDHNNNLTDYCLEVDKNTLVQRNIYKYFTGKEPLKSFIHPGRYCDIIPSTIELVRINKDVSDPYPMAKKLRKDLLKLNYDYVIVDTAGSLTTEYEIGLIVSDKVLVPMNFSKWSMDTMEIIESVLESTSKQLRRNIDIAYVANNVTQNQGEVLKQNHPEFTENFIPKNNEIVNCHNTGKLLKINQKTFTSFENLMREIA